MNGSETKKLLREELSKYSKRCFNRGLVSGTGGNLSVRVSETDTVLITPSGLSLGEVEPEQMLLVTMDGEVLEVLPGLVPSKETSFHLGAYRLRPDVEALAHVHPPYATAYSTKGEPLPLVTVSARANLHHVPVVGCAPAGSSELRDFVCTGLESAPDAKAILMAEHGILTLGKDLRTVYYLADLVEDSAKVAFIASHMKED